MNASHQTTAIDLELRFTGTACTDTATLLAQRAAATTKPRKAVTQLGQLNLSLTLGARSVLGEDVEDHCGAIKRGAT